MCSPKELIAPARESDCVKSVANCCYEANSVDGGKFL